MIAFVYWPHVFEKNNKNYPVFKEMNARVV